MYNDFCCACLERYPRLPVLRLSYRVMVLGPRLSLLAVSALGNPSLHNTDMISFFLGWLCIISHVLLSYQLLRVALIT